MRNLKSMLMLVTIIGVVLFGAALLGAAQPVAGQGADGRLNCDEAAPVVLYCQSDSLEIFRVGPNGAIDLALEVPYTALDDIARPDPSTWIAGTADGLVNVYVLDTWQVQVNVFNGDELWVARWWDCPGDPAEVEVFSRITGERLSREWDTCGIPETEPVETVLYCDYTDPYTGEPGSTACDQLCEYGADQLWFCDDLCASEAGPWPCGDLAS